MKGTPCSSRSKMSTGLVNVPEKSILSFSQTCGSGENGARPSVRQSTTTIDRGIESKIFTIPLNRGEKPISSFLELCQPLNMPLFLGDDEINLPAGIFIIEHALDKLVEKDRVLLKGF